MKSCNSKVYTIATDKVYQGIRSGKLANIGMYHGSTPRAIFINESEKNHFIQLLFIIRNKSLYHNTWCSFTREQLKLWVFDDIDIYFENKFLFGFQFAKDFMNQVDKFIDDYCVETTA